MGTKKFWRFYRANIHLENWSFLVHLENKSSGLIKISKHDDILLVAKLQEKI